MVKFSRSGKYVLRKGKSGKKRHHLKDEYKKKSKHSKGKVKRGSKIRGWEKTHEYEAPYGYYEWTNIIGGNTVTVSLERKRPFGPSDWGIRIVSKYSGEPEFMGPYNKEKALMIAKDWMRKHPRG